MSDIKNYIIDPLTSLCKVALLHFLPTNTKLAISHHILLVQGYSYYQWIERTKNGDNRFDISHLYVPFTKAIKWYIVDNSERIELDNDTLDSIRIITRFTIMGLHKLQNYTYKEDIAIKIILQYLINILEDALNGIFDESKSIKSENTTNILSDKIKNSFGKQTINTIAKNLNDADKLKNHQDDSNTLVECVHKLLLNHDTVFIKLMKQINTTL